MSRKTVAIVGVCVLLLLAIGWAVLHSWVSACPLTHPGFNVRYTFSEFEEVDGTGIYVSEVLEMNRGEMDQCSADNKLTIKSLDIYLMDNQGLTAWPPSDVTETLWSLQDNYAGNWEEKVNWSTEIANDNGTEFPIHFENQMDNDFEKYGESAPTWQEVFREDELYLSVGDKIKVYGSGSEANGPAESDWSIIIKWRPWGEPIPYHDLVIP